MSTLTVKPNIHYGQSIPSALFSTDMMEQAIWQHYTNNIQSQVAHRRFLNTDVPMAIALSAATLGGFLAYDNQTVAINSLKKLAQYRQQAIEASKYLRHQNIDAVGQLGLLELGLKLGEPASKIQSLYRQFTLKNASHPGLSVLRQAVSGYLQLYQNIIEHPKRLQQMLVPALVRPLKMSEYQARVLAKAQPQELLRKIFQSGFQSDLGNTGFFTRVVNGLIQANWIRAGIAAGSVFALFMGAYVTRMEMKMHNKE